MRLLTSTTNPLLLRTSFLTSLRPTPRTFTTTPRSQLKEDKPQSPQEIEQAKQQQKQSEEKRRELKSSSEEVVGAEQDKVQDHGKHMEELQKETAAKAEREGGKR